MRVLFLGALVLAGCSSPSAGGVACGPKNKACPDGYHCAVDQVCWKNGEDPDLGSGSRADLSPTSADLSQLPADLSAPPPDLSTLGDMTSAPVDMASPPRDLAGLDGPHAAPAIIAAGGGGVKAAGSTHSITFSVGQKTSGVAAGTAHRIQLGILYGTQAK